MTMDKIEKIEAQFYEQQKLLGRIEGTLENIERSIITSISIKDEVITQREKHKVTENRLIDAEKELKEVNKAINTINLKIAMASGAWAVIVYIISKIGT